MGTEEAGLVDEGRRGRPGRGAYQAPNAQRATVHLIRHLTCPSVRPRGKCYRLLARQRMRTELAREVENSCRQPQTSYERPEQRGTNHECGEPTASFAPHDGSPSSHSRLTATRS